MPPKRLFTLMCHHLRSVKFWGIIELYRAFTFCYQPVQVVSPAVCVCAGTENLYQSDAALQSTSFKWALHTRTNLAGKMNFKKCNFNQGFWICVLSRNVLCLSFSDCCSDKRSKTRESGCSSLLWRGNLAELPQGVWTITILVILMHVQFPCPSNFQTNTTCVSITRDEFCRQVPSAFLVGFFCLAWFFFLNSSSFKHHQKELKAVKLTNPTPLCKKALQK